MLIRYDSMIPFRGSVTMRKVIRNPYFRVCWICLALGLVFLAIGLSLVAFLSRDDVMEGKSREGFIAVAFVSCALAFGLLCGSFMAGFMARRVHRFVGLIRIGDYLVHWSYRPEEWEAFQIAESSLLRRDFRNSVVVPLLIGIPIGLLLLTVQVFSTNNPDVGGLLIAVIGTCAFVALLLAGAYYSRVIRRRVWGRDQKLSPPDSYLHRDFAYANGEFLFGVFNQQLIEVQVLPDEPVRIEFTVRSHAPRGGEMLETRRVLVPAGQQKQAGEVVAEIRAAWRLN